MLLSVPSTLSRSRYHALRAAMLVLAALPALSPAQVKYSRTFTTRVKKTNLSLWPAGSDKGDNLSRVLVGPEWGPFSRSLDAYGELTIPAFYVAGLKVTPEINLGKTGFQVSYAGSGAVGFDLLPYYSGGRMDLDYVAGVTVTGIPSLPKPGDRVELKMQYQTGAGSYFNTTAPDFGLGIDAIFQLSGSASTRGWFLGDKLFDERLFDPFSVDKQAQVLGLTKFTESDAVDRFNRAFNQLVGVANPVPVNANVLKPVLTVQGETVNLGDKSLSGTGFAPFLSVQTDMLAWIAAFMPGGPGIALKQLSGDYPVPGTGLNVRWDIAKMYANLNLGFRGDYRVVPTATMKLNVYRVSDDGKETPYASDVNGVSFTMPNGKVRIRPSLSLDLRLKSSLGFAAGGEIGTSPFRVGADGSIGSGSHKQTYDFDIDPAKIAWKPDPSSSSKFVDKSYAFEHVDRDFDGFILNLANLLELPPNILPDGFGDPTPIEIFAYDQDANTAFDSRKTVDLNAQAGYTFMRGSAGSHIDAEVVPAESNAPNPYYFDPNSRDIVSNQKLRFVFRSQDLKPGRFTLHVWLKGTNPNGVAKATEYRVPFNINYRKSILDAAIRVKPDADTHVLNRVPADGQPHTIYIRAKYLYTTTQVVMNGNVVLPRGVSVDDPNLIQDGQYVAVTIPADVAQRFAGQRNTIRFRNPNLAGDGTTYLDSDALPLFIYAPASTLLKLRYNDADNASLPLGKDAVGFEVRGTNLANATQLNLVWTRKRDAVNMGVTSRLDVSYAGGGALRATIPASLLADIHQNAANGTFNVQAVTPSFLIPTDDDHATPVTGGGVSGQIPLKLVHPTPTINRFDPPVLLKDSGAQQVKVYGDNLLRNPSPYYASNLASSFGPGASIVYPNGSDLSVPYLILNLPANHEALVNVGRHDYRLVYADAKSAFNTLITEYGKPSLNGTEAKLVIRPSGIAPLTLTGGPFYAQTKAYLNGTSLTISSRTIDKLVITPTLAQLATLRGTTAPLVVSNPTPGGGDSNAMTVRLVEGDPASFTIEKGAMTFNRFTGVYTQAVTIRYTGNHELPAKASLVLRGLASGTTVLGADGLDNGAPLFNVSISSGLARLTLSFKRSGASSLDYTPELKLP